MAEKGKNAKKASFPFRGEKIFLRRKMYSFYLFFSFGKWQSGVSLLPSPSPPPSTLFLFQCVKENFPLSLHCASEKMYIPRPARVTGAQCITKPFYICDALKNSRTETVFVAAAVSRKREGKIRKVAKAQSCATSANAS